MEVGDEALSRRGGHTLCLKLSDALRHELDTLKHNKPERHGTLHLTPSILRPFSYD
jgi:hypothetical protein